MRLRRFTTTSKHHGGRRRDAFQFVNLTRRCNWTHRPRRQGGEVDGGVRRPPESRRGGLDCGFHQTRREGHGDRNPTHTASTRIAFVSHRARRRTGAAARGAQRVDALEQERRQRALGAATSNSSGLELSASAAAFSSRICHARDTCVSARPHLTDGKPKRQRTVEAVVCDKNTSPDAFTASSSRSLKASRPAAGTLRGTRGNTRR